MPLAKITIDMEKPSQWVSKLCRLYFADEYARRTVGVPRQHTSQISKQRSRRSRNPPKAWGKNDWITGWMAGHLPDTSHTRIGSEGTSSFLYVPQRIRVSRIIPRLEGHGIFRPIWIVHTSHRWPGEMHHPEIKPQNLQVIWNLQFITVFVPHGWSLLSTIACVGIASRTRVPPVK